MTMNEKINQLVIPPAESIINAMKKMDELRRKLLIVGDGSTYSGLLSIGDIQRALINNHKFTDPVSTIMRNDYIIAKPGQSADEIKNTMLKMRTEFMPVVGDDNSILKIYFWEDLFEDEAPHIFNTFNLPVVIMAGGLGTRLRPLTNVLPKPLIPIGENTIVEEIFNRFAIFGCDTFYISVNYKSELIEYYLKNKNLPYNLNYFKEKLPRGTAGSLSLLKGRIDKTFFVTNCDILIEQDYAEVLHYHKGNSNEITLVAVLKHYPLPYGTLDTGENGKLISLTEKPELIFKINSGMYILEPHLLNEIPDKQVFDITQLIEKIKCREGRIGVFPVSENSWKDIGDWNLFLRENLIKEKL
jgi:dTDP-glucose pyrophosphorylase